MCFGATSPHVDIVVGIGRTIGQIGGACFLSCSSHGSTVQPPLLPLPNSHHPEQTAINLVECELSKTLEWTTDGAK